MPKSKATSRADQHPDPATNFGERPLTLAAWPTPQRHLKPDQVIEVEITRQLAAMSLAEKVAQIIQADIASITPEEAKKYNIGAILNGGNSAPHGRFDASAKEWLALVDSFWDESDATSIPIIFGTDAVHGHSNIAGATIFPHNINLGAARDIDLAKAIGVATAKEIAVTGMDWTFSPTVAVAKDLRWGRTYEAFSCDPSLVCSLGAAMIIGLQGEPDTKDFLGPDKVACAAKHFLGDGATQDGRDQGETNCSESELITQHAAPYIAAIEAGATAIMASFSSWGGQGMHGRHDMLTALLKQHWQFDGLVAGDWNGHGQLPGAAPSHAPQALAAGLDMYMAPDSWRALLASTLEVVAADAGLEARLDDAVLRMLRFKARLGLSKKGRPATRPLAGRFDLLGCPEHRELARRAVRQSAVLLKNDNGILPLAPSQHMLVCGRGADGLDLACGGWTLSWQGGGDFRGLFPGSQTLLEGLQAKISSSGGQVTFDSAGHWNDKPDVAVVVLGEEPYAEFRGDCETLAYRPGDPSDYQLIERLAEAGIPVVTVLFSGRPLWMNPALNKSAAFIAAFLPGTQAGALADLLIASEGQLDFQGRLPFPWPAYSDHFDLCAVSPSRAPLFSLGFGLSLFDQVAWQPVHEQSDAKRHDPLTIFDRGIPQGDWTATLSDAACSTSIRKPNLTGGTASHAGHVNLRAADFGQQENAWAIQWTDEACLSFIGPPLNLSREANADYALYLTAVTKEPEVIGVALLPQHHLDQPLAKFMTLLGATAQQDQSFVIPLKRFAELGLDMNHVCQLVLQGREKSGLLLVKAYFAPMVAGSA
ncbi:MAG: glycoside hydrolase family 3 N-terminal domain-containing protein [Hyphomonadaceae bacterium]|jgi:beta-glucosidase